MTVVFPGGNVNTYVPSTEATNNMVVDFSRNPSKFAVNKYTKLMPVTKGVGLYTSMTIEERGRITQTNLAKHMWADGDDAPDFRGETESFEFLPYQTKRVAFGFRMGQKAAKQAAWDILAQHAGIKAQQAMTGRTQLAVTVATTAGNYPAANTSAVSSISGVTGKWDVSTTARLDIKRSIDHALDIIRLATLDAVSMDDFKLVMSPGCARKIAVSQEIADFIKGSPDALPYIKGKLGPNAQYGLPERLYGVELVIEATAKVTSKKGATRVASYVLSDTTPFIVARVGSLEAGTDTNKGPRFDTITGFFLEDMTVESKSDTDNRVEKGRVVDDYVYKMTAGISGFLFTAAVT